MKNENVLKCFEAKENMILSRDLIYNDQILLAKDLKITYTIANKIQSLCPLTDLYVYSDDSSFDISDVTFTNNPKVQHTEKALSKITKYTEELFNTSVLSNSINMTDVRNICSNLTKELKNKGTVLKNVIEDREVEEYLFRHSVNVSVLSSLLAKWLNLSEKDIIQASYAGMLHDIGKLYVDPKILNKTENLTKQELEECYNHTKYGYKLSKAIPFIDNSIKYAILLHHERIDGSGYPLKLKDDQIPLLAKIVAVSDIFDAMTSNTVYRKKMVTLDALEEMQKDMFKNLFPDVVSVFLKNIISYYIGSFVKLSNGDVAKIISIDFNNLSRPLVLTKDGMIDLKNNISLKIICDL